MSVLETVAALRCDVEGCADEMTIHLGDEQRCYRHALERGNQIRAARGLPPIMFDDKGDTHAVQ